MRTPKTPPLHRGYCTDCDKPVWARAWAQRAEPSQGIDANEEFILWPRPGTLFAVLDAPGGGEAPGIPFCRQCVPEIGTPDIIAGLGPVIRFERPIERYPDRFNPRRELFLRVWLKDALNYEPRHVDELMDVWHQDCRLNG